MPVGDIIRRSALRFPDKTAMVFGTKSMSYRVFNERINRLANRLLKMGLRKGDRIAALLHNGPEFFEIYYASAKVGGIFVPVNNLLRPTELKQILEYVDPRFLFFDSDYESVIGTAIDDGDAIEYQIALGSPASGLFKRYEELIEKGEPEEPKVPISDDDVVSIFLTSGTTGRPKGAMRTHRHVYIDVLVGAIELSLRHDDRALMVFPFYHVTWEDNMRHVLMANTIVIRKEGSFDAKEVLGLLEAHQITVCQLVPTMISTILQIEDLEKYDLSRLRLLTYTASPMPVELLKRTMRRFKCQFMQFYGQTETGPLTTVLRPEDHVLEGSEAQSAKLASAGRTILNYEARIVDPKGRDLPAGEVGELIVRSESMTIGYWRLPEETEKAIKDGWLHTGDFARLDEEGYVYIVDRKNDMIISGGKNIYPREIEEVLYRHDAVLEAAVIGVPDDHWGESVRALVVLKPGRKASEADIVSFCRQNLASYKKPRWIEFREELPKNPTGKILKRVIRDEYWKGRERKI
ncbi:MAG: long-chain-fatty-acid--CoA ligase [Deltaproteobacteria bacterium]|nr:long-chain-fatty-acid--CoA ligase [Deltaproteobacteria bacterium]